MDNIPMVRTKNWTEEADEYARPYKGSPYYDYVREAFLAGMRTECDKWIK